MNQEDAAPVQQVGPADRAFLEISPALARESAADRIVGLTLTAAVRLGEADGGLMFLLDQELRHLYCEAVVSPVAAPTEAMDIEDPACSDDPLVYALRSGRPVRIPVLQRYSGFACERLRSCLRNQDARPTSALAVPVADHSGHAVGVLVLLRWSPALAATDGDTDAPVPDPFGDCETDLVLRFAEHAATAVVAARLMLENAHLQTRLQDLPVAPPVPVDDAPDPFAAITGNSVAMRSVMTLARRVAPTDATVLLLGETGTGKDVFARAIHRASRRADQPFIAQNCAAIPETLLEAELFGWKKGAFSGADRDRPGLFAAAGGGTLFLDEIGDMPLSLQAKLLRVLQDGRVRPLGGRTEEPVDVRIIAATHRDLASRVSEETFRADLYYRLAVFPLDLPALRERMEDLPLLVQQFAVEVARQAGTPVPEFGAETLAMFQRYAWPGNVRELRNAVERMALLAGCADEDQSAAIRALITGPASRSAAPVCTPPTPGAWDAMSLRDAVAQFETEVIRRCLHDAGGSSRQAAELLGVPRRTLADKIRRYGLGSLIKEPLT